MYMLVSGLLGSLIYMMLQPAPLQPVPVSPIMHATLSVFLMTSFLFLSLSETPSIHRSILISVLSSSPSSFLITAQASAP